MKKLAFVVAFFLLISLFVSCGMQSDIVIHTEKHVQVCESTESGGISETTAVRGDGLFVIINKNSKIFHVSPDCVYAGRISEKNRLEITVSDRVYLYEHGYSACGVCSNEYKEKNPEEKS